MNTSSAMLAIYLSLAANLCFSVAIVLYTQISHKTSVLWMNTVKGTVAFACFLATVTVLTGWNPISQVSLLCFFASGFIGLAIGDMALLKGFTLIGPSRTMVLFGFQPLLMGLLALILFDQAFPLYKLVAVLFLMGCLFLFSYERFKANKEWGLGGIAYAFLGMLLDAVGILLTRYGFDQSTKLHAFEGNVYRCAGALVGFLLIGKFVRPIRFLHFFSQMTNREKGVILFASVMGTFLSLGFYLQAIKIGHLASITAISITGPLFSALFESLYFKKWPSWYFLASLVLFGIGFSILNF